MRRISPCRTLNAMNVEFTPEQEAELGEIAARSGTVTEQLVKDAALRLVNQDHRFRRAVEDGLQQAELGQFIEEEEMELRLEQMLRA